MLSLVATNILYPDMILKSAISSTLSLTSSLISSIGYLKSLTKHDTELYNLLNLSDILNDVFIIKSFIEEKQTKNSSQTVSMCIANLSETLSELEKHVNSIIKKIKNHKNLWFNRFRSYDIAFEQSQIPILNEQMKHRFELLIKISSSI